MNLQSQIKIYIFIIKVPLLMHTPSFTCPPPPLFFSFSCKNQATLYTVKLVSNAVFKAVWKKLQVISHTF